MAKRSGDIWSETPRREVVAPSVDEHGNESHPSWALASIHRVSATPGAVLFDSDIRHSHYISVQLEEATRKRDLKHDRLYGRKRFIEFHMSEAQWASFVSSVNTTGVPVTMIVREDDHFIPEEPYEPRLQESMDEVHRAGEEAVANIRAAFEVYKEHKTVGNLRHLEAVIQNMPANLEFAARSLSEHAENVVTRARFDIEAALISKAEQLGLDPADLSDALPQLTTGEES